jgi:BirA family biotin operon repressor/biotin-[acetyl-CoA-carboxylase] ligase
VPAPGAAGLRLKWPNDLMVGAAKLGGILVESTTLATTTLAMIGIGINIAEAPPVAGRGVTCLARHVAGPPSPQRLLEEIAAPMAAWIASWRGGEGFAAVRAAWLARGQEPGEPIAVRVGEEEHRGTFGGLETDGALVLVDAAGGRRRFTFGDVTAVTEGVEGQWRAR